MDIEEIFFSNKKNSLNEVTILFKLFSQNL